MPHIPATVAAAVTVMIMAIVVVVVMIVVVIATILSKQCPTTREKGKRFVSVANIIFIRGTNPWGRLIGFLKLHNWKI